MAGVPAGVRAVPLSDKFGDNSRVLQCGSHRENTQCSPLVRCRLRLEHLRLSSLLSPAGVTLIVAYDAARLTMLDGLCASWGGHVSAAVYQVDSQDSQTCLNFAKVRGCSSQRRSWRPGRHHAERSMCQLQRPHWRRRVPDVEKDMISVTRDSRASVFVRHAMLDHLCISWGGHIGM